MKKISVVIPVYKPQISVSEKTSLRQCLSVLTKYDIVLVCPNDLDISLYNSIFKEFNKNPVLKTFSPGNFTNIQSYNKLMLDANFYAAFQEYDYILIYQLDSFVFSSNLTDWCEKGYDFIGAPVLIDGSSEVISNSPMLVIGNGGFSLRKISSFIKILNLKGNVLSIKGLVKINSNSSVWKIIPLVILGLFGYRNTIRYFQTKYQYNEDIVWSCVAYNRKHKFATPDFVTALKFAFEQNVQFLFSINNNQLPFGCHAFMKYDYESFWKNFIKI